MNNAPKVIYNKSGYLCFRRSCFEHMRHIYFYLILHTYILRPGFIRRLQMYKKCFDSKKMTITDGSKNKQRSK